MTHWADACAVIHFFGEPASRLSRDGRLAMQGSVQVSALTIWELARKVALGKLPPLPTTNGSLASYLLARGLLMLDLDWRDAEAANALPNLHRDPMDRMLIAQALRRDLTIITDDRVFPSYGVRTVW